MLRSPLDDIFDDIGIYGFPATSAPGYTNTPTLMANCAASCAAQGKTFHSWTGLTCNCANVQAQTQTQTDIACTMDAKECPDGSFVGRNPNKNCAFDDCPTIQSSNGEIITIIEPFPFTQWIKENPILSIGIAGLVVMMFSRK